MTLYSNFTQKRVKKHQNMALIIKTGVVNTPVADTVYIIITQTKIIILSQSVLWLPLYKTTDHQSINSIMMGLETLQHFQAKKYWMRDGVRKTVLSKRRVNSIGKKKKDQKLSSQVFFALDRSKITITTTTS